MSLSYFLFNYPTLNEKKEQLPTGNSSIQSQSYVSLMEYLIILGLLLIPTFIHPEYLYQFICDGYND